VIDVIRRRHREVDTMKATPMAIVLGLLLSLAVAAPVGAAEQRPMTGQFTAQAGPADPRCGDDLTLGFEIRGVAAHLGALTGTGSNCTEWSLATSAVAAWDGRATFVAADGSTLTTTSEGTQAAPVAGLATFAITHTIRGGSGRFADATGVWTVTGVLDFTTGTVSGQVTGWLSY
jgi:hypothetical protein